MKPKRLETLVDLFRTPSPSDDSEAERILEQVYLENDDDPENGMDELTDEWIPF